MASLSLFILSIVCSVPAVRSIHTLPALPQTTLYAVHTTNISSMTPSEKITADGFADVYNTTNTTKNISSINTTVVETSLTSMMHSASVPEAAAAGVNNATKTNTSISLDNIVESATLMHRVYSVITFTFPKNSTWNVSNVDVEAISTSMEDFLKNQALFSNIPITLEVTMGDTHNILPSLISNETKDIDVTMGEPIIVTVVITVPSWNLNEYMLGLAVEELFYQGKSQLEKYFSEEIGFDFSTNGVKVDYYVLSQQDTTFPTYAPTSQQEFSDAKKQRRTRSWIIVSAFWVIVMTCYAMENGLCACKTWRANKDRYGSVDIEGHLD